MDIQKILQDIGLSEKEAKVYIACLMFPNQVTSILAKKSQLNRGTTFVILNSLLEKGLVSKNLSSEFPTFSALPPEELLDYLEKEKQKIAQHQQILTSIIPDLQRLQGKSFAKPFFEFFEGRNGIQKMLAQSLKHSQPMIKAIINIQNLLDIIGKENFEEYQEKVFTNQTNLQILVSFYDYEKNMHTMFSEHSIIKYMPEPLYFPMMMFLYGESVLLISQKDGFGLSITSSEYHQLQETFFDTIWAISRNEIKENEFRMPII